MGKFGNVKTGDGFISLWCGLLVNGALLVVVPSLLKKPSRSVGAVAPYHPSFMSSTILAEYWTIQASRAGPGPTRTSPQVARGMLTAAGTTSGAGPQNIKVGAIGH